MTRREYLAVAGVATAGATAGCSLAAGGEGETVEIVVRNGTAARAYVAVRLEDDRGDPLFSRTYELGPEQSDESAGIRTTPATVVAFTPAGASATWAYAPDEDIDGPGGDVGIALTDDGIEPFYTP